MDNNLKLERVKLKMNQKDLAKLLDVSTNTVSRWENNNILPNVVQAGKLSKIFKKPIEELFFLEKNNI